MALPPAAKYAAYALVGCVAIPLYLGVLFAFLGVWFALTITLIGPGLHWVLNRQDAALLGSCVEPALEATVQLVDVGGTKLAVRWSPVKGTTLPPVCIPNGLGATLVTISRLHEVLVSLGFSTLSYDRAGVGMSGPRTGKGNHAGAEEVVADMAAVLNHVSNSETKWILVGPSMGSIVAQAFIAAHPTRVCGFVNMDGFPFPFAAKRNRFEWSAVVYRAYAAIVWTGALRPFLFAARGHFKPFASKAFSTEVVRAQMNQRVFFSSLAAEMLTMMDLADAVRDRVYPTGKSEVCTLSRR